MNDGGPEVSPAPPRTLARKPLRVLIAHQSTIPHYRVRFYELLEKLRPPDWTFEVVFDPAERTKPRVYEEPVDHLAFNFPLYETPTTVVPLGQRRLVWQHFVRHVSDVDLLVTDTHLSNLSYPIGALRAKKAGLKWVLWGHVGNRNVEKMSRATRLAEWFKKKYVAHSDAFFAYTDRERQSLLALGYNPNKIQVLNNTIDIEAQRAHFLAIRSTRDHLREEMGVAGKIVLLHVGRLIPGKRIPFLCEMFTELYTKDARYHLVVVGSGSDSGEVQALQAKLGTGAVSYPGAITKTDELGKWFTASNLFVMPGYVGLAPLQAICYDLRVVYFDLKVHSPEVEYLNPVNSLCLPGAASSADAALQIRTFLSNHTGDSNSGTDVFATIEHLTLEAMAIRFIEGVGRCLQL